LPLRIACSKLVEVPLGAVVKPYKYHQLDGQKEFYDLAIAIQYHTTETLYKSIFKLYELFRSKNSFHYEQDLDRMFFLNQDFYSNTVFDKTRIKSLSEKTVLHKEFKVKQVIPLVQMEGILYLTNKRVYFQPYHQIQSKPVMNYKIKDIRELFVRRYKLLNIGLELMTAKGKSLYVIFLTTEERDQFYQELRRLVSGDCVTAEHSVIEYTQ
jgi:factor associated with neutral sphingomyelinase activation